MEINARVYIAINKCRKFWIFVIKTVLRCLLSICIYNFIRSLKLFLNLKLVETKFNRVYDLENSYAVRKLRRFLGETWRNEILEILDSKKGRIEIIVSFDRKSRARKLDVLIANVARMLRIIHDKWRVEGGGKAVISQDFRNVGPIYRA